MPSLLDRTADWLPCEITAGRIIGDGSLPELAATARAALSNAARLAAQFARALQAAGALIADLRPDDQTAGR